MILLQIGRYQMLYLKSWQKLRQHNVQKYVLYLTHADNILRNSFTPESCRNMSGEGDQERIYSEKTL